MKLKRQTYFYPEKPVLILKEANAMDDMSNDPYYVAELKYNGSRCQLHFFNGNAEFWDRHGKKLDYDSNPLYSEGRKAIVDDLKKLVGNKGYFLFDCELRHNKAGVQNKIVIYDIHVYDGELLIEKKFVERRALLMTIFRLANHDNGKSPVSLITQYYDGFRKLFDECKNTDNPDEIEGIVIKDLRGNLQLGRTSSSNSLWMFKVRHATGRHRY